MIDGPREIVKMRRGGGFAEMRNWVLHDKPANKIIVTIMYLNKY